MFPRPGYSQIYGSTNRQYFGDFTGSPADVEVSFSYRVGTAPFLLSGKCPSTGSIAVLPGKRAREREREKKRELEGETE